jgi:hypothetical protein
VARSWSAGRKAEEGEGAVTGRDDPAEQAAHLAQIILAAQTIVEEYIAEKITVEEAMTALVGIIDAPALTEWLITNGFLSKQ